MRLPGHGNVCEPEDGSRADEVAVELDLDAELLAGLADDTGDELLTGLDAAAGRAPDALREMGLADQRQPLAVEHEQRHVVTARRAVHDHRQLRVAHLAVPVEQGRLAELLPDASQDSLVDVH
jgi:hypothetical protein